ncbi:FecR family protein [Novosphingobium malaysiense]|uniref:FecR family protein n=1 Tax=Novosphingobium malaysiense TaxID=1348853 RepID=UPI000689A936|nr:FecR domain-containing protein [Novosphingobium malaysiense]
MSIASWFSRTRRIERQASRWVMLMIDDPHRYGPRVKRWMERSPEHRATYSRMVAGLGRAGTAARMLPELQDAVAPKQAPAIWHPGTPLALAALALLAAAGMAVFLQLKAAKPYPEPTDVESISYSAPGQKTVELADGSHVILFGSTRLVTHFSAKERRIDLLAGRARFDVKHDASRPFVVMAQGGSVTALGTVFEVEVGQQVAVHLLRGRIRVVMPKAAPDRSPRNVILTPGQNVSYAPDIRADASIRHDARVASSADATDQQMDSQTFDDVPVSTIIAAVNRQSAVQIELADPAIGQEKIFAQINFLSADSVARKLAQILDLSIDRSRPGRLRLIKAN